MFRLSLSMLLFVTTASLAGVYKWVDEDGTVHYSDRPSEQAETLRVPGMGRSPDTTEKATASEAEQASPSPPAGPGGGYTVFEIVQPEPNQTFRIDTGEVTVGMLLEPGLQQGHHIQLSVDGVALKDRLSSTQLVLRNLGRGSHTLTASVVDATGQTVTAAVPVSFHLRAAPPATATPDQTQP